MRYLLPILILACNGQNEPDTGDAPIVTYNDECADDDFETVVIEASCGADDSVSFSTEAPSFVDSLVCGVTGCQVGEAEPERVGDRYVWDLWCYADSTVIAEATIPCGSELVMSAT